MSAQQSELFKAQQNAKLQRQQDAQNFAQNVQAFQNALMNSSQKLANIAQFLQIIHLQ
ncbi:MAG: hypothetical protein ACLSA2_00855 [Candidatus Gastranaerophilaceae bacterium]